MDKNIDRLKRLALIGAIGAALGGCCSHGHVQVHGPCYNPHCNPHEAKLIFRDGTYYARPLPRRCHHR